jgi:uncharacterized SAM-binding protein YcdF (DUF218 family)
MPPTPAPQINPDRPPSTRVSVLVAALLYVIPVGLAAAGLVLIGLWQIAVILVGVELIVSGLLLRLRRRQPAAPADEATASLPYLLRPSTPRAGSPVPVLLGMVGVVVIVAAITEVATH